MNFTIETLNDNGSGMSYRTKEDFLREIGLMIDDCIANGGTFFDVQVDSDASCFSSEDAEIDEIYHDYSEEELREMGCFDSLNDEEDECYEN